MVRATVMKESYSTFQTLLHYHLTCSFHCISFLGLPFRILNVELVKPKKGTTMETIGSPNSLELGV